MQLIKQPLNIDKTSKQRVDCINRDNLIKCANSIRHAIDDYIFCPDDVCLLIARFIIRTERCSLYYINRDKCDLNIQPFEKYLVEINNDIDWDSPIKRGDIVRIDIERVQFDRDILPPYDFVIFDGNILVLFEYRNRSTIVPGVLLGTLPEQFCRKTFPINYWSFIPNLVIAIDLDITEYLPEIIRNLEIASYICPDDPYVRYETEFSYFTYEGDNMVIFNSYELIEDEHPEHDEHPRESLIDILTDNAWNSCTNLPNNNDEYTKYNNHSKQYARLVEPIFVTPLESLSPIHQFIEQYTSVDRYYHIFVPDTFQG